MNNIITTFKEYLNESNSERIYSGEEVWDYFSKIESMHQSKDEDPIHNGHDVQIKENDYVLRDIQIKDLINNDIDLETFIKNELEFYKEDWYVNDVTSYGLIGNNDYASDVLIDGYHRITQKVINNEDTFKVFIPLSSKYY